MISIAMTTYNGARFLKEQLDSLLTQTFSDWELIICDDCSTDGTVEILKDYADVDHRIKIFLNDRNLGFKKNFEQAISLCKGDYIALCDQDDIWVSKHLEILISNLGESVLVCGSVALCDEYGIPMRNRFENRYVSTDSEKQFFQLLHMNFIQGCACLFKRELVSKILPIPKSQKYHDNWIGLVAGINEKPIVFLKDIVLYYRRHENNVTVKKNVSAIETTREKLKWNEDIKKFIKKQSQENIYNSVYEYSLRFTKKKFCFMDIIYFLKNYKLIYQTKNHLLLVPRFIKRFFIFA